MYKNMYFVSSREFYEKRDTIRAKYSLLSFAKKCIYKSYVYSRDIYYANKNIIWEFLNEPDDSEYFIKAKLDMISFKGSKK